LEGPVKKLGTRVFFGDGRKPEAQNFLKALLGAYFFTPGCPSCRPCTDGKVSQQTRFTSNERIVQKKGVKRTRAKTMAAALLLYNSRHVYLQQRRHRQVQI